MKKEVCVWVCEKTKKKKWSSLLAIEMIREVDYRVGTYNLDTANRRTREAERTLQVYLWLFVQLKAMAPILDTVQYANRTSTCMYSSH